MEKNSVDTILAQHQALLNQIVQVAAEPGGMLPTERLAQIWHMLDQAAVFRRVVDNDHSAIDVMQILLRHRPR